MAFSILLLQLSRGSILFSEFKINFLISTPENLGGKVKLNFLEKELTIECNQKEMKKTTRDEVCKVIWSREVTFVSFVNCQDYRGHNRFLNWKKFHTRCITPKRLTNKRGPSPCRCVCRQHSFF